jgi:hypothetical protein
MHVIKIECLLMVCGRLFRSKPRASNRWRLVDRHRQWCEVMREMEYNRGVQKWNYRAWRIRGRQVS